MAIDFQSANNYADVQSLNKLKYTSDENAPETLRFVAEQFEAIFLQMMLKSARSETDDDNLFDSQQTEFYQDWHDKQLAINLASGKGIGIAEMLVKQLQVNDDKAQTKGGPAQVFGLEGVVRQAPAATPSLQSPEKPAELSVSVMTPKEFVQNMWPYAKAAADKLGASPEVILAQAALETGWGKKISQRVSGESSYNLFNIKADGRWQGDSVSVSTLEFREGTAVKEKAQFRAYASYEESFADYVSFIKSSSRYQPALAVANDAHAFTRELSAAGYATDPEYSNKIMSIATGDPMKNALGLIKI